MGTECRETEGQVILEGTEGRHSSLAFGARPCISQPECSSACGHVAARRTMAQGDPVDAELAAVGRGQLGHLGGIQAA